jgi:cation diffusion facilitator CzcD-associated flavoprotein CzcO
LTHRITDIPTPHYEFSDPNLWTSWNWSQRFPGSGELREYFQHVAKKWDLRKDCIFDTHISSATWSDEIQKWTIGTNVGKRFVARFFLPCTGFAAKPYIPDWKGIENFRGTFLHPSEWPTGELPLKGKRIAVIG